MFLNLKVAGVERCGLESTCSSYNIQHLLYIGLIFAAEKRISLETELYSSRKNYT